MKSNFIQTIKVIALAGVLAFGVQYASAQNWVGPSGSPPGNNVPAPLNVGASGQIKLGGITLGSGLNASGMALNLPNGKVMLKLPTPPTVGQVLSAADTSGTLKWSNDATGGGAAANTLNFYQENSSGVPQFLGASTGLNARNGNGIGITVSPGWAGIGLTLPYKLPQGCTLGQVPKPASNGSGAWVCANDNGGGSVSVSTSCTYVYGNGTSQNQDLNCPANNVMAGTKVADTNSGCALSPSNPSCGARLVAIKCCPIN